MIRTRIHERRSRPCSRGSVSPDLMRMALASPHLGPVWAEAQHAAESTASGLTEPGYKRSASQIKNQKSSIINARAFSLIEVVLGVTILAMLTTTMFALVRSSVKATGDMQRIQRESDELNRLLEIFRTTFQTLPSSATIELALPGTGVGANQELTITGAPAIFAFGERPTSYQPTIISLQPDPKGGTSEEGAPLYDLSISRQDIIPATDGRGIVVQQSMADKVADDQGRYWMPLMPNVQTVKWRFLKESTDEWLEIWSEAQWPDLIELNLQLKDRRVPIRLVYPLPQLQLRAPTNTSSRTTTSGRTNPPTATPPPQQGGNTGGGGNQPQSGGGGTPR